MRFTSASIPIVMCVLLAISCVGAASAQEKSPSNVAVAPGTLPVVKQAGDASQEPIDKRIFGVLPNYRTANESAVYQPIPTKRKFYIAMKDSLDYPSYVLAGIFAGIAQFDDTHADFGQGLPGYGHRYATAAADQVIGNFMTEAIMPTLFREDPRYFRRGHGRKWARAGYAATRVFVTHTDAGGTSFNYAEIVGNAVTAGIGNAYYPLERTGFDNFQRFYSQVGTDALSQVLKEFWPDLKRHFKHQPPAATD